MKKITLALTIIAFSVAHCFAFVISPVSEHTPLASSLMLPVMGTEKKISLADYVTISPKNYAILSGKKMKWADKIGFRLTQRKLKRVINEDGTVNMKKLEKMRNSSDFFGDFEITGFALGVLLSLVGVLIAYLIDDAKKKERVKWAWLGFVVSLVLFGAFII